MQISAVTWTFPRLPREESPVVGALLWSCLDACFVCNENGLFLPRKSPVGVGRAWLKCPDLVWNGRSDGGKERKLYTDATKSYGPHKKQKGFWLRLLPFSPGAGNSSLAFASLRASESWLLKSLEANYCCGTWLKDSWVWCSSLHSQGSLHGPNLTFQRKHQKYFPHVHSPHTFGIFK